MPLDNKFKDEIKSMMFSSVLKFTALNEKNIKLITDCLEFIILTLKALKKDSDFEKIFRSVDKKLIAILEKESSLLEDFKNCLDYFLEPALIAIKKEDTFEFYTLMQEILQKKYENLQANQINKIYVEWNKNQVQIQFNELVKILKKDYPIISLKKNLDEYINSYNKDSEKLLARIFVHGLNETIEFIPCKNNKPIAKNIGEIINTLKKALEKLLYRLPKVDQLQLETVWNQSCKTLNQQWFKIKAKELNDNPKKSMSVYPEPWFAQLRGTLINKPSMEDFHFEALLDQIAEEQNDYADLLEEEQEEISEFATLEICANKQIREALLDGSLKISNLIFNIGELRNSIYDIFVNNEKEPSFLTNATLLCLEASASDLACMLINMCAKQVFPNESIPSLLHAAMSLKDNTVWKILIKNRLAINLQDKEGNTPIHLSIQSSELRSLENNLERINAFLENEANFLLPNKKGQTPLALAVLLFGKDNKFASSKIITRLTEVEKLQIIERDKKEAEEKAKREAIEKAKREAEEKARREAEEKMKRVAEEKLKREAEEKLKREAEQKAKYYAELKAKKEIEKMDCETQTNSNQSFHGFSPLHESRKRKNDNDYDIDNNEENVNESTPLFSSESSSNQSYSLSNNVNKRLKL